MLSRNFSNILVLEGLWLYIGLIKTTMASHCRILRTNVDIVTDHRYQIITNISQKKSPVKTKLILMHLKDGIFLECLEKLLASFEIKNVVIINFLCLLQSNFSKKKNCVYMK